MLSSYVLERKRVINQMPFQKWSIITVLPAYSNITRPCQLCLYEKYAIITCPDPENLLNKRSEFMSKYLHQRNLLLSNYDTRDWKPDLINQKKLLETLKRKCFWKILLLQPNNVLFEQNSGYGLNNLLFGWFKVKCLNTLMFK